MKDKNEDDSLCFKVEADMFMSKGWAILVVSHEDYSLMSKHGWNMEKPSGEYKYNRITFKNQNNEPVKEEK